ncbi:MAG: helix-turn-helix domain-containing protein [Rhizonema sp. NSF051]|nr:helix-turn-helix domain-containing protein [Rhizonema sp. NSF051]
MNINDVSIEKFNIQAQAMYDRLAGLYESASVKLLPDILPQAYKELGSASEILHLAIEELHQQNEELVQTRNLIDAERQRYANLFEFAPDCYLVTDTLGVIKEANHRASQLFNVPQQYLVGNLIVNFIAAEDRRYFRCELTTLSQCDQVKELTLRLQQSKGKYFDTSISVAVVRHDVNEPISLRWIIRKAKNTQFIETFTNNEHDLCKNRSIHKYSKGEIISLNWQAIWYVCRGVVKLSTLCETGEELLVGMAGVGMIFGFGMTSLQTYQATALSDVELVSIGQAELESSLMLNIALLPKINQRLRQAESFLVISGMRRVQDRFYYLLQLLKQEIGEPVASGMRLSVRLTHEDLASACCTTRVTVTRLMGKLQKQGKITFDAKKHLIIKDTLPTSDHKSGVPNIVQVSELTTKEA